MDATILIIEDEKNINDILAFTFEKEGYKTLSAYDGITGVDMALKNNPNIVLLDINLPGMDGMDACKEIRKISNVPIIMLTAREDEVDKIVGLELGADDYITKPYSARELSARVKALLRRSEISASAQPKTENINTITSGDVVINIDRYEVKKNGQTVDITLREFELLKFLAVAPSQIFSREVLLENVWGYEYLGDMRTVDVTIRRLREKIEDDPSMPRYIMTKRSIGYYFNKI
ncbi:MAG: response regulator transcription factor [Oscillospiraceae bacterium]|nr:response regulator transcription factor [Oscillospiraceae bacterium]